MFFDMLAIPADAPHPSNAHLFINYLLRPDVAAKNSATDALRHQQCRRLRAGRSGGVPRPRHLSDRGSRWRILYPNAAHSQAYTRELNRTWTRFKTGT